LRVIDLFVMGEVRCEMVVGTAAQRTSGIARAPQNEHLSADCSSCRTIRSCPEVWLSGLVVDLPRRLNRQNCGSSDGVEYSASVNSKLAGQFCQAAI
jgi:hypothetical protein